MDDGRDVTAHTAHDGPVSSNLGITDASHAPPATRAGSSGWRDPRLWIGLALVAASVLVGARVLAGADRTVEVWAVVADQPPGGALAEDDLVARRVRFVDDADLAAYLPVRDGLPERRTLVRAVGGGELLPAAALGDGVEERTEVPVWAPAEAVAGSIEPGSVVDVWVTGGGGGDGRVVLDDVVVLAAARPADTFGPGGRRQVLVGVTGADEQGIGEVLAAAREDRVAITREG